MWPLLLAAAADQPESTTAGIIGAIAGVVTALAVLIGALTVFVPVLRSTRRVESEVKKVHTIVNQQRTDAQRYQVALTEALRDAGIAIPVDQSLPVTGRADQDKGGQPRAAQDQAPGPTTITLTGEMTEGGPDAG